MNRRGSPLTQSDIARATRAAKAAGATGVEIYPDGRVVIRLDTLPEFPAKPVDVIALPVI